MARQYGADSDKGRLAHEQKLREQEEDMIRRHKIEKYSSIGVLVLGVVILVVNILSANSYKAKTAEIYNQLNEQQGKLSELSEQKSDSSTTTVEIEAVASSAKGAGEAVCVAQNDLIAAIKAEQAAGMDTLSENHQAALNKLRQYFIQEGNGNLIRGTWVDYGVWEFNGVYEFEGNNITVVWKCYAPDDKDKERLLAFVKAIYNAETDTFTKGELKKTSWYQTIAKDRLVEADEGEAYYDEIAAEDAANNTYQELDAYGNPIGSNATSDTTEAPATDNQHLDHY